MQFSKEIQQISVGAGAFDGPLPIDQNWLSDLRSLRGVEAPPPTDGCFKQFTKPIFTNFTIARFLYLRFRYSRLGEYVLKLFFVVDPPAIHGYVTADDLLNGFADVIHRVALGG